MERSKAINIIAYRFIEAGIGTAHNKIGRNDNLGIGSDADFLDNPKGSRICGRKFGRLFALEALYLNILILYDLAQMLLDIFCGRAGHHSEVCRNRCFLRENVGGRAALGHGDAVVVLMSEAVGGICSMINFARGLSSQRLQATTLTGYVVLLPRLEKSLRTNGSSFDLN